MLITMRDVYRKIQDTKTRPQTMTPQQNYIISALLTSMRYDHQCADNIYVFDI